MTKFDLMSTLAVLQPIIALGYQAIPTGSRVFNGHGNDQDILVGPNAAFIGVLEGPAWANFVSEFAVMGFIPQDKWEYPSPEGKQISMRKGDINLIVVDRVELFTRWHQAASLCQVLAHLTPGGITKRQRCAVHKIICDHHTAGEALSICQTIEEYV